MKGRCILKLTNVLNLLYWNISFMHTQVPEGIKGNAIASALAANAFNFAKERSKLLMGLLPFRIFLYKKRHPEVREQLNKKNYH